MSLEDLGIVSAPPGRNTILTTYPASRVQGRVTTRLPGVNVSGLEVSYQDSHPVRPMSRSNSHNTFFRKNSAGTTLTDNQGRFTFDDLDEGTINIFVTEPGDNTTWTFRAAQDVELKSGRTQEVKIELITGVEVKGKVVDRESGLPVAGAMMGTYGPYRPRSGAATQSAMTDEEGVYRYRLPPGETYFYVMGPPPGYIRQLQNGSSRTVTIPERAMYNEVPPIEIAAQSAGGPATKPAAKPTIFDPTRDAAKDIELAIEEADRTGKRILLDVGGNWCVWCYEMERYFEVQKDLRALRDRNYVTVKVNWSPENKNEEVLTQYPKISGYPHLFVLGKTGALLHSQNTAELEDGQKSYDLEKFTAFLKKWAPPAK